MSEYWERGEIPERLRPGPLPADGGGFRHRKRLPKEDVAVGHTSIGNRLGEVRFRYQPAYNPYSLLGHLGQKRITRTCNKTKEPGMMPGLWIRRDARQ